MTPWRSEPAAKIHPAALLAALLTALAGCAFDDGEPWGAVHVELTASAPETLRTADGRSVEIDRLELATDAVLLFAGASSASAAFDPADPPEGCTLCHGGHCHCGDALVDYEELAARVAGAGDDAAPVAALSAEGPAVALGAEPRGVPLVGCVGGCPVPRGALRRVEVRIVGLRAVGRVDGASFDLELALDAGISAGTEVVFDRGQPVDATLDLALTLPVELLDGIDPAAPAPDAAAISSDNLATFARLAVDVRRP